MAKLAILQPPRQVYKLALSSGAVIPFLVGQRVRIPEEVVPFLETVKCNRGHPSFKFESVPDHSDLERMLGVQLQFPAIAGSVGG